MKGSPNEQQSRLTTSLGPLLAGMLGPQVSRDFGTLLGNLARKAEAA